MNLQVYDIEGETAEAMRWPIQHTNRQLRGLGTKHHEIRRDVVGNGRTEGREKKASDARVSANEISR